MSCMTSPTEEACLSNELCSYTNGTCAFDQDSIMDTIMPQSCWMCAFYDASMECGQPETEGECNANDQCQWNSGTACHGENPVPYSSCGIGPDSMVADLLGEAAARQHRVCLASETESACASVTAAPDDADD